MDITQLSMLPDDLFTSDLLASKEVDGNASACFTLGQWSLVKCKGKVGSSSSTLGPIHAIDWDLSNITSSNVIDCTSLLAWRNSQVNAGIVYKHWPDIHEFITQTIDFYNRCIRLSWYYNSVKNTCPLYTHVTPLFCNALVHVIYSGVSGKCLFRSIW